MISGLTGRILGLPRVGKRGIALAVDALLCSATVALAYYLRLDAWVYPIGTQWLSYVGALVLALPIFVTFGLYRAIFRYAGWGALMAVVRACAVYGLIYSSVFTMVGVEDVPRTTGIIQPVLLFLAIGASRGFTRYWLGGGYHMLSRLGQRRRVMIYGAGAAGRQLAAALASSDEMQVVGFVDDDPALHGSLLNGKMIYSPRDLTKLIEKLDIADLLLALPSATRRRRNEILDLIKGSPTVIRTLPGLNDLAQGRVTVSDLRELDIEDLLGRDAVPPDTRLMAKNITGKTVLVTGAGGSIGSELCRQALLLQPAVLLLVELSEFNLYTIYQDLEKKIAGSGQTVTQLVPLLASADDARRIDSILATWKPETIYHAAAYKHVPLVEHNPAEGVRNNVFGTLTTAQAAMANRVSDFVLISTDKAVRPTSVMGTSKRLAEMVLQAMAATSTSTRFSMVRFGNVLGSSGSVVPLFREQIRTGGPITITHEDITRYFMTIPEAAQLVIQAGAMAKGGDVFVLDMGDPVRIFDLASRMIDLSGLTLRDERHPDGDIEISVIGMRPGEKLYEELLIGNNPIKTSHPRIMCANEDFVPWELLNKALAELRVSVDSNDVASTIAMLKRLVPEFSAQNGAVPVPDVELVEG